MPGSPRHPPMLRPLALCAAALAASPLNAQCPVDQVQPPGDGSGRRFGSYLDTSGDWTVVARGGQFGRREAHVLRRSGGLWSVFDVLDTGPTGGAPVDPVSISGSTLVAGNSTVDGERGVVHAFEFDGAAWTPAGALQPPDVPAGAQFGRRVRIDGGVLAVAAPTDGSSEPRGGSVHLFERDGAGWSRVARLEPLSLRPFAFFGLGLALSGDLLAVGEPGLVTGAGAAGDVALHRRTALGTWQLEALFPPDVLGFGYEVELAGDLLFIASPLAPPPQGSGSGVVHVHRRGAAGWATVQTLTPPLGATASGFGRTLRWSEGRLFVGCAAAELDAGDCPLWIFEDQGGTLVPTASIEPTAGSFGGFGASVDAAGPDLWVGTPRAAEGNTGLVGRAELFALEELATGYCPQDTPNSAGTPGTLAASGCATLAANNLVLRVSGLPAGALCVPVVGPSETFMPAIFGGPDALCVHGRPVRGAPATADAAGRVTAPLDLTAIPAPGGTAVASAGDRWYCQFVYLDGSALRATDALELTVR